MSVVPELIERPKLCFIAPAINTQPGSAVTATERLSAYFKKSGYEVIAVSSYRNRVYRMLDIVLTLIKKRYEVDIVFIDVYSGRSFVVSDIATRVARLLSKKTVMILHGGALPQFAERFTGWCKKVFERATVITAPSTYLAQVPGDASRVIIIPNAITLEAYPFRMRQSVRPKILWMRTFHPIWNPSLAVRVVRELVRRGLEPSMVMAGQDRGELSSIRRLTRELGVSQHIRFAGFLTFEQKIEAGSDADVFVNTNRIDNMPVSVIEACAMGLPVVSTEVGGIPHMLKEGESALFAKDDDAESMADAIQRLVGNPDLVQTLSMGARRFAEQCSWESVRPMWEKVLDDLR